jgi:predicted lipoprotein with Yx(FWY)xxD motif
MRNDHGTPAPERRPRLRLRATALVAAAVATAASAGAALAASTVVLRSSHNSTVNKTIVVDPSGRTLYTLSGESSSHLKCTSSSCTRIWFPFTVAKGTKLKASGVKGTLSTFRRGSSLQVTLSGKPLYRFSGDRSKGQANGEGISSFGGTWHVVAASSTSGIPTTGSTGGKQPGYY